MHDEEEAGFLTDLLGEMESGYSALLEGVHAAICKVVEERASQKTEDEKEEFRKSLTRDIGQTLMRTRCGMPLEYRMDHLPDWAFSRSAPAAGGGGSVLGPGASSRSG